MDASCATDPRIITSALYASVTLLLLDYALTLSQEVQFFQERHQTSALHYTYLIARYSGLLSAICVPFTQSRFVDLFVAGLMCFTVISSNLLLVLRTCALYLKGRNTSRLWIIITIVYFVPSIVITVLGRLKENTTYLCSSANLPNTHLYGLSVGSCLAYNIINFAFALFVIIRWRRSVVFANGGGVTIIDILWKDGTIYALAMLGISVVNLMLHYKLRIQPAPGLQIHSNLHSALSTRIVLHLACSQKVQENRNLSLPSSLHFARDQLHEPNRTGHELDSTPY